MKQLHQLSIVIIGLVISSMLGFPGPLAVVSAATSPSLGTAASYSILAGSAVTNTGATTISGDVGISPGAGAGNTTGFGTVTLGGTVHDADGAAGTAQGDKNTAYTALASQGCDIDFGGGIKELAGEILVPGVYCAGSFHLTSGTLTLNGAASDVWIFKSASDLIITGSAAEVVFTGGGLPCNVWWRVVSTATFDAGSSFVGNILADTSITFAAGASLNGRALARTAEVTLSSNSITGPTCAAPPPPPPGPATLHVVKQVVNNSGGVATASTFNLHVKLLGADVAGSPAAGVVSPGTSYSLVAGTYVVSEDVNASYAPSFSGDCDASGNITLASGEDKTCTITNDDIAPGLPASINVVKTVINDNGRTKTVADFPLFINGTPVVSGVTNVFPAPAVYTVTETTDPNYTRTFSGDCDINGSLNLMAGDSKFCIVTNNDTAQAQGGGGGSLPVVVPPVPPLIGVVKVPSPLALPAGPGPVTYTYTLRNIGTVPVTNITLVGDTCSPIILVSGDTNADAKLDLNETWTHSCTTTLSATHTNNVVATGWANNLSAIDIASATVVVGVPIVVPPLIHVTKVPSPLTLLAGGGMVTYTETITNPGTVALSNVRLTDDTCSPMQFISGDSNGDSRLDATESWTYTCRSNLTQTTTNTAIASGEANGLTVRDFATATVVVATAVPGLPKTGVAPAPSVREGSVVLAGIFALLVLLYATQKKKNS